MAEKAEKLLDEITIKIDAKRKREFSGLTAIKGTNVSEVVRAMIETYVNENRREFDAMKAIFVDEDGSDKV